MVKAGFEISGTEDILKVLNDIAPRHAINLMRATVHGIAGKVANDARENAPKDKGVLKKAIKHKRRKSRPEAPVSEVYVEHGNSAKHDAFYWRFQEYGTSGPHANPEQPFIRPAVDGVKANLKEIMVKEFGKKLEKSLAREAKKKAKK